MNYKQIDLKEIDSTNSYLKRNWKSLDDMTFVFADYQTNGYGRFDRKWESSPKNNLLFSLLIKNNGVLKSPEKLTTLFPYIIVYILTYYKINDVSIKWPNDIYVKNKKICGMIFESQLPNYLIVGVGLNVNQEDALLETATSISQLKNQKYDLVKLKSQIINITCDALKNINSLTQKVNEMYQSKNYLLNKKIEFELNNKKLVGIVKSVDIENHLIVDVDGEILSLNSGEVKLIKN